MLLIFCEMRYHSLMRIHNEFLSEKNKKSEKILTKISYDRNHSIEEKHPHFYEFRFALAVEKRKLNKNLCKFFFLSLSVQHTLFVIWHNVYNEMKMNFYKIPSFNIFHIPYSSVFHFFFVIEYSPFFLAYGRHTLKASHHISLMDHFHHH